MEKHDVKYAFKESACLVDKTFTLNDEHQRNSIYEADENLPVRDFEECVFELDYPSECKSILKTQLDLSTNNVNFITTEKEVSTKFREIIVCSTCGKEFKRKDHLKKHLVIHSAIKKFSCLVCGKRFSRKDRLKEHFVIHSTNGWCCYFCGKIFSQRCILRKHEMIHRGLKPFSCDLCDGRFSRKNDLTRHTTIHTGEKKYLCNFCGKGFTQKRLVNRHMVIHKEKNS